MHNNLLTDLYVRVKPFYADLSRHYHCLDHIDRMLHGYFFVKPVYELSEVLAILYHDIVYDPTSATNEEDSAVMLREHHRLFFPQVSMEDVDSACRIILDTKTHIPTSRLSELVLDLDMMQLADTPALYEQNTRNIRKEYSMYSDSEWAVGRTKFLETALNGPRLYHTLFAQKQFGPQARKNIKAELEKLSNGRVP